MVDTRRFYRNYKAVIYVTGQAVEITPPFSMSFSVNESTDTKNPNKLTLKIKGLAANTRSRVAKYESDNKYIQIEFFLGYKDSIRRVFKGNVKECSSAREGAGFTTTFNCEDGGHDFRYAYTSKVVEGKENAISAIIEDMPNTAKGAITQQDSLVRPKVLIGNSYDLIQESNRGKQVYIKDERINILAEEETTGVRAVLVTSKTGLLDTPIFKDGAITFQTMFNPEIEIGGIISLDSHLAPDLNGIYKITQISSSGGTDGGDYKQTCSAKLTKDYVVVRNE